MKVLATYELDFALNNPSRIATWLATDNKATSNKEIGIK